MQRSMTHTVYMECKSRDCFQVLLIFGRHPHADKKTCSRVAVSMSVWHNIQKAFCHGLAALLDLANDSDQDASSQANAGWVDC